MTTRDKLIRAMRIGGLSRWQKQAVLILYEAEGLACAIRYVNAVMLEREV